MTKVFEDGEMEFLSNASEETRERMQKFWSKHSQFANMEEMLLDTNAEAISDNELPEILSILPSFKSKIVLELGAGIGRFTKVLAKQAANVTAVDFVPRFIEKNRDSNLNFNNIDYIHGDVTQLEFAKNHYNMIFSNWLLMYLNDFEIQSLVEKCLRSMKSDGFLFFRESCFHASGNIKKVDKHENPTNYRSPTQYIDMFLSKVIEINGENYGFELIFARPNRTYVEKLENFHGFNTLKEFLDHKQYTTNGILRYERIFGSGFISTGGKETTEEFLKMLDLKENQRVLDVGCGIGGGDFIMAEKYGVEVYGVDLATNSICIAWERAQKYPNLKVRFEIADITKHEFPAEYFDVIYSRDTILHLADKKSLFGKFKKWLKPGGKVFITDYVCGPKPWCDQFAAYVEQRGYNLLTVEDYGKTFADLGFVNVKPEDKTDLFVYHLNRELELFEESRESFIQEFSLADYDYLVQGWKDKLVRCEQGDQKWGFFYAEKDDL